MPSILNHLAITTDNYNTLGMFYRTYFDRAVSGDTNRERRPISLGDGYVGITPIPRRSGRRACIDYFSIEVEIFEETNAKIVQFYPDLEIVERPSGRPFASFSTHDPAGNYFDLSQIGHGNRSEVYEMKRWKQDITITHFAIRVIEVERVANFYSKIFGLKSINDPGKDRGHRFTDIRVTMSILRWKISDFYESGIEQLAMDHIGFRASNLNSFIRRVDKWTNENPHIAPRLIGFTDKCKARLALLKRSPYAAYSLTDPDGNLTTVSETPNC